MTGQGRIILHGGETNKKGDKQEKATTDEEGHAKSSFFLVPTPLGLPVFLFVSYSVLQGAKPREETSRLALCGLQEYIPRARRARRARRGTQSWQWWHLVGCWLLARGQGSRMKHEASTPRTLHTLPVVQVVKHEVPCAGPLFDRF